MDCHLSGEVLDIFCNADCQLRVVNVCNYFEDEHGRVLMLRHINLLGWGEERRWSTWPLALMSSLAEVVAYPKCLR